MNHAKQIVFSVGDVGVPGKGFNDLNAPYSAYVIGDFTGLTPPNDNDDDADDSVSGG